MRRQRRRGRPPLTAAEVTRRREEGKALAAHRARLGWTQLQLADEAGCSRTQVSAAEGGCRMCPLLRHWWDGEQAEEISR